MMIKMAEEEDTVMKTVEMMRTAEIEGDGEEGEKDRMM